MKTTAFKPMSDLGPVSSGSGLFVWLEERLRDLPNALVVSALLILSIAIGWADFASGWELSLFIFYALPIALAVWRFGTPAGLFVSAFCGVIWWIANEAEQPYETLLGYVWALFSRLFYFGVVVFAVTTVRNKQKADAAYIRMLEERRQMEEDIVRVSEHEQQRIGQDLHDGLCQNLAAIGCAVRVLAEELQTQNIPGAKDAEMIEGAIQQSVLEARNLARGIFPVHVDRSGLSAALVDLAKTMSGLTGASIVVKDPVDVSVEQPDVSMHLYRIAQEALANAVRHSGATEIVISMNVIGDDLELRIEDNGSGIDERAGSQGDGMGLRTMRYRSQTLGATLEAARRAVGGTCVSCRLQLKQPAKQSYEQN